MENSAENTLDSWRPVLTRVSGGYMIRVNGFPLYQIGLELGAVIEKLGMVTTMRSELLPKLTEARPYLEAAAGRRAWWSDAQSVLPPDSKAAANAVLTAIDSIATKQNAPDLPALDQTEQNTLIGAILWFNNILARDLHWFDLYWVEPKLGYTTTDLLTDATIIFPKGGDLSDG
jgi:hypothetical protein